MHIPGNIARNREMDGKQEYESELGVIYRLSQAGGRHVNGAISSPAN